MTRITGRLTLARAMAIGAFTLLLPGVVTANDGQGADASVQFRPIEEYIQAQGTTFVAPEWYSASWADLESMRIMLVDYTGLANRWIEQQSE